MPMIQRWIPAPARCGAFPDRSQGTLGKVRAQPAPGKDSPPRVRQICCRTPGSAGPGQAQDVRFPGVHALLQHQEGRRRLSTRAQDTEKANESQAPGDQGNTTTAQAYADRRAGTVARGHDERQFRILRGADQHIPAVGLPLSHQHYLVPKSAATQPAASADVGAHGPTYQAVPTVTARAAPVAKPSVPRQILEVGAECVSSARSDLCGLRLESACNPAAWNGGRGKA